MRKVGPRIHLAIITLFWGACMIGMGFVKDWEQMAGMRVLLGFLEAGESPPRPLAPASPARRIILLTRICVTGFFPSCVYLLSTWYTRCKSGSQSSWGFRTWG